MLLKNVGKTALGESPPQRHLATFKPRPHSSPGPRELALGAASCGLSVTRAHSLSDSFPPLRRASRRMKRTCVYSHIFSAYPFGSTTGSPPLPSDSVSRPFAVPASSATFAEASRSCLPSLFEAG